jgi:hypothetical protein
MHTNPRPSGVRGPAGITWRRRAVGGLLPFSSGDLRFARQQVSSASPPSSVWADVERMAQVLKGRHVVDAVDGQRMTRDRSPLHPVVGTALGNSAGLVPGAGRPPEWLFSQQRSVVIFRCGPKSGTSCADKVETDTSRHELLEFLAIRALALRRS